MEQSIILFEPWPFETRRGEWGRWKVGCDVCGCDDVARLCFHCGQFRCFDCMGQASPHLWWLYERARARLLCVPVN